MLLSDLLPRLRPRSVSGPVDRAVRAVTHDSRQAGPDDVFVAIRGEKADGRRFAPGLKVAAVIADGPVDAADGVAVVLVDDARRALAEAAAAVAGDPGLHLDVIGVTGTNGKTTTTFLLERILQAAGRKPGVIGTTGHRLDGQPLPDGPFTRFTTPEAPALQGLLAQMLAGGCDAVAMEVSSIGLDLRRVDGIPFRAGVFTSFSRDHLDFHPDMGQYLAAKRRLFAELLVPYGEAVLNGDDPACAETPSMATTWRYSLQDPTAEIYASDVQYSLEGTSARVRTPRGDGNLRLRLIGRYNLQNALAALGAALSVGVAVDAALAGLAALESVPGRLERVPGEGPAVFVDYAHTPDALEQVLAVLRPLVGGGRIWTVFGCGGDRDRGKRPLMGAAAAAGSDRVVVTSDNPRSEDPAAILADIRPGLEGAAAYEVIPDRAEAIQRAVGAAAGEDIVLIAGKGHESYQIVGQDVRPFSDVAVAAAALSLRVAREARASQEGA